MSALGTLGSYEHSQLGTQLSIRRWHSKEIIFSHYLFWLHKHEHFFHNSPHVERRKWSSDGVVHDGSQCCGGSWTAACCKECKEPKWQTWRKTKRLFTAFTKIHWSEPKFKIQVSPLHVRPSGLCDPSDPPFKECLRTRPFSLRWPIRIDSSFSKWATNYHVFVDKHHNQNHIEEYRDKNQEKLPKKKTLTTLTPLFPLWTRQPLLHMDVTQNKVPDQQGQRNKERLSKERRVPYLNHLLL